LIGDASGHGIAAAVVMAIIHTVLHSHPLLTGGPANLLHYANQDLCEKKLGGFVTLFLAIYEPATGKLIYSSAGHPAPLHRIGEKGVLSELNKAATHPIGIDPHQTFEESSVQLAAGDMLLLYTDGVTEARSPTHEMLDVEPLRQAISAANDSPADVIKNLRAAVIQHQGDSCPVDDQTMVVAYAHPIS
jgi:sigma-B regulation protein RsbU (phosphoserine phosphatase)